MCPLLYICKSDTAACVCMLQEESSEPMTGMCSHVGSCKRKKKEGESLTIKWKTVLQLVAFRDGQHEVLYVHKGVKDSAICPTGNTGNGG